MYRDTRLSVYILIFTAIVFFLVFLLPFYIPRQIPAVSSSYDYGFNNTVAVVGLCFSLLAGSMLFFKYLKNLTQHLLFENIFIKTASTRLSIKSVYIIFLIHSFTILCLYLLNANYGYGEGNYFLLRVDRLSLGQEPYKDFEYAYGILLIYLPKSITDLFRFSTSIPGYYISLTLLNTTGIFFLYYVINSFNVPKRRKGIIFILLGLSCIPLSLGMNYILIRFITPVASLIALSRLIGKLEGVSFKNCMFIAFATITVSIFNFIISIEVGIAVLLSILGYLFLSIVLTKKLYHIITLTICGVLITSVLLFLAKDVGLAIKVFAAGGNNWVVIPSPSIVLFIISFLTINLIFCTAIIKKNISFLICTLLIFNTIMIAGAFGRCDPGHIYWYGLSSFILMWMLMAYINDKYFKVYTIAFVAIFNIGMTFSGLYLYKTELSTLMFRYFIRRGEMNVLNKFADVIHYDTTKIIRYADKINDSIASKGLSRYGKIALPFDAEGDVYLFLLKNHLFSPEYYTGYFLNTFTENQINTKLGELHDRNHKYMLIPEDIFNFSYGSDISAEKKFISLLFLYPFNYTKKRDSRKIYSPVFKYIHDHYKPLQFLKNRLVLVERAN